MSMWMNDIKYKYVFVPSEKFSTWRVLKLFIVSFYFHQLLPCTQWTYTAISQSSVPFVCHRGAKNQLHSWNICSCFLYTNYRQIAWAYFPKLLEHKVDDFIFFMAYIRWTVKGGTDSTVQECISHNCDKFTAPCNRSFALHLIIFFHI